MKHMHHLICDMAVSQRELPTKEFALKPTHMRKKNSLRGWFNYTSCSLLCSIVKPVCNLRAFDGTTVMGKNNDPYCHSDTSTV